MLVVGHFIKMRFRTNSRSKKKKKTPRGLKKDIYTSNESIK